MHVQIDDQNVGGTTGTPAMATYPIEFNADGSLNTATLPSILVDNWDPANGAFGPANGGAPTQPPTSSNFVINIAGSTQFGQTFSVANADQDGFAPGRLTGLEIDDSGVVFARYTNGESLVLAQVALANFDNPQGLSPLGNTAWAESFQSGEPVIGAPQSGALGAIQSGALEDSNVDLSEQLVQLIIAQRNFQANAKTIETADTVTQAIINLR
jgi:flagellar hook protein FlgE